MNYYIHGDAANADKIKAAFEKLGIDVLDFGFADKTVVYCSIGGCVQYLPYSINLMHILYSHPGYKELELPHKFKVEDWVVFNNSHNSIYQISEIRDSYYMLTHTHGGSMSLSFSQGKLIRPWTIEDAKDGDVLATDNGWACIFKAFDGWTFSSYCFMDSQNWFCEFGSEVHTPDSRINGNIHPATKEQRDLLFAKMKEAGYEWDAGKKVLKKIQPHYDIANFYAGMPVLVRADNSYSWDYSVFSRITSNEYWKFSVCNGASFTQCIPFNKETKHLLGTTDLCDERFINW